MAILTTIIVGIAAKIVADDVKAWLPFLSQHLLKIAVSRLPEEMRARYKEEWAADLLSYPGEFVKCFRALGLCWASIRIGGSARKTLVSIIADKLFLLLFMLYLKLVSKFIKSENARSTRLRSERATSAIDQSTRYKLFLKVNAVLVKSGTARLTRWIGERASAEKK